MPRNSVIKEECDNKKQLFVDHCIPIKSRQDRFKKVGIEFDCELINKQEVPRKQKVSDCNEKRFVEKGNLVSLCKWDNKCYPVIKT